MKRALITGGAGFVGRHFANRFLKDGWQVTIVDNLSTGTYPPKHDKQTVVLDDLRTWVTNGAYQADPSDFDLIIHCAAVVGGRLKIEGEPLAVATDLAIDSDFFNWLALHNTKTKVIYFSSSAVYPIELQTREQHCPLVEQFTHFASNRIGRPDLTYGWAKLTGEYLAKHAVEKYGLDVVIYRPFSGYGEDQSSDYPFPAIIKRVVTGSDPITIWGSGEQCRDFIHIDDIVTCVLLTMNELDPGEVLNLGSGKGISFADLAVEACNILGHEANLQYDISKPEGVFYRVADTFKMNQFYKPKVSLEEGIKRVADYLRK